MKLYPGADTPQDLEDEPDGGGERDGSGNLNKEPYRPPEPWDVEHKQPKHMDF